MVAKPCKKPGGIQSMLERSVSSTKLAHCPKVSEPFLISTTTSSTLPATTRTSLPWAMAPCCMCKPLSTPADEKD